MTDSTLSNARNAVRDSSRWDLYMAIDNKTIDVMLYNPHEDNSLVVTSLPVDKSKTAEGNLRDAVYDNAVLPGDFRRVTLLLREPAIGIIPTEVAGTPLEEPLAAIMPGDTGGILLKDSLPLLDATVLYRWDRDAYHFMQRTYRNLRTMHSVSSLTRYAHGSQRVTGSETTYVYLWDGVTTIVIYRGNNLLHACRYETPVTDDTLYYIAACRQMCVADASRPVVVGGNRDEVKSLLERARGLFPGICPAVFPAAMFRSGGDTALNTPTDLIVMPLCE